MFQHPSSAFDTSQQLQLQLHQNTCKYNTQINFSTEPTIQLLCNLCLAYSQKRYAMFSCDCVKCHCNIYINNNNNYNYNKPSNEHRSPQSRSQSAWCGRTTNALTPLPCSRGLKANRWHRTSMFQIHMQSLILPTRLALQGRQLTRQHNRKSQSMPA